VGVVGGSLKSDEYMLIHDRLTSFNDYCNVLFS